MKVFTYYTTCPGHDQESELKLIALWRDAWTRQGFEPFVLQEWHARQHPQFNEYHNVVSQLPTVNSAAYERACFIRWLALAQVGGGFMSDYDVFPRRDDFDGDLGLLPMTGRDLNKLCMFQSRNVCPSLVYAHKSVAERVCNLFVTTAGGRREINGKPHASDQYMLEDWVATNPDWLVQKDLVRDYEGTPDWDKAKFVHFNNGSMTPRGKVPRWKHIPAILAQP